MSIIPANIDYIKMAQMVKFAKYTLKQLEEAGSFKKTEEEKTKIENMRWVIGKIEKILDEGIPLHTLKAVKGEA